MCSGPANEGQSELTSRGITSAAYIAQCDFPSHGVFFFFFFSLTSDVTLNFQHYVLLIRHGDVPEIL